MTEVLGKMSEICLVACYKDIF